MPSQKAKADAEAAEAAKAEAAAKAKVANANEKKVRTEARKKFTKRCKNAHYFLPEDKRADPEALQVASQEIEAVRKWLSVDRYGCGLVRLIWMLKV